MIWKILKLELFMFSEEIYCSLTTSNFDCSNPEEKNKGKENPCFAACDEMLFEF